MDDKNCIDYKTLLDLFLYLFILAYECSKSFVQRVVEQVSVYTAELSAHGSRSVSLYSVYFTRPTYIGRASDCSDCSQAACLPSAAPEYICHLVGMQYDAYSRINSCVSVNLQLIQLRLIAPPGPLYCTYWWAAMDAAS